MSILMDLGQEDWPSVGGQLPPCFPDLKAWNQPGAAIYNSAYGYITVCSLNAEDWPFYDLKEQSLSSYGEKPIVCAETVEEQVYDCLPTAPEDSRMSDSQIRQFVPLLHTNNEFDPVGSNIEVQSYVVQPHSEQNFGLLNLQLSPSVQATSETDYNGMTVNVGTEEANVMDVLSQLCDTIDSDMVIDPVELAALCPYPCLPQVFPEDIDSLLSSDPLSSHLDVSIPSPSLVTVISPPSSPYSDHGSLSSSEPSSPVPPVERKQRKKEQNKTAALRYRQKKRSEHGSVMTEYEDLEKRNTDLKTKVSEMMKEIDYLKGLIAEIYA